MLMCQNLWKDQCTDFLEFYRFTFVYLHDQLILYQRTTWSVFLRKPYCCTANKLVIEIFIHLVVNDSFKNL